MRKWIYSIFALLLLTKLYAQDPIKDYPGIPLITYMSIGPNYGHLIPPEQINQIEKAGIYSLVWPDLTQKYFNDSIITQTDSLLLLPEQRGQYFNTLNYIYKYTEARYTVFEAEGTPNNEGSVTLYSDSLQNLVRNNGSVSTTDTTPNGTMIYGPMYRQCRNYSGISNDSIWYQASYWIKIDDIIPEQSSPNDTVCILEVTSTRTWTSTPYIVGNDTFYIQPFTGFEVTLVHAKRVVTYSMLQPGVWDTINVDYYFPRDEATWYRPEATYRKDSHIAYLESSADMSAKISQNCVEFKVIWKGDPQKVKLSVDKIVVSDQRGRDLMFTPDPTGFINQQLDQGDTDFANRLAGWIGLDEPWSLDTWEPIRMVQDILDRSTQKPSLYFQFNVGFNGRFHPWEDPARASKVDMMDEFMKRVGKANVWITGWLYDMPCSEDAFLPPCDQVSDYKNYNINVLADSIYKKIMLAGRLYPELNYGMSIQTGKYGYSDEHRIREITGRELLYNSNLALIYGSKFISPWAYFGVITGQGYIYTGFRNLQDNFAITDKYLTLRDTIAPRLSGLMGITLKKINATDQILKIPLNAQFLYSNFIDKVIKGDCTAQGSQTGEYNYDLGFFTDSLSRDYFMIISRWYNGGCDPALTIKLKPEYYANYNLKIVDYINNQTFNTNRFGSINTAPVVGDAGFFGVFPILQYGGTITSNDTTYDGETLFDDLIIDGANLYIDEDYNAKANITVKNGGKIIAGTNGKIIFDPGKKLIIEGTAEIKGTSASNKLSLEFAGTEKGLDVMPGSNLMLNYCNISGAYNGLVTRTGTPGYLNITNSNFAFGSTGIVLNGNFYGEGSSTSATSTISNCNFTTSGTGIGVTNNSSVIISQNNFTSCGISILNVPAAYIQGNNISAGTNTSNPGIFFNNSGGYIRSNIIKNRVNGIHLANSSPDVGGNILEDNYKHGLYIGSGSIPNLVGYIQVNPPLYFPLRGYNTIRNNGINPVPGTENDGSEIYLSSANISLRDGCNEIVDDRQNPPNTGTILLVNGSLAVGGGRQLDARNNYWGTITPTSSRFGSLSVLFTPYYGSPCPIPDGGSGGEESFVLTTLNGEVIDTIRSAEGTPAELTALEASYSEADKLFATGNAEQSKTIYEQIVNSSYTAEEKLTAYNRLYTIGNLLGVDENYFNSLQNTFENISVNEADTLLKSIYNHNAIKCDVSKEEYLIAINKFDNIIQQNPNSEEAVYVEIDIMTTALNLDTTNTGLGKIAGGKYLVKGTSDYITKLNNLLQNKFGINTEDQEQLIPKEYSLYQNYPNPFNPTTTIKFDLPKDGLITLEIFDILGRRITTLINEYKTAGSYEQLFDASSLASGVYVYKLQAGDFISSQKMIFLK